MNYENIFKDVSTELNIPIEVVKFAYKSYWKFIRDTIELLPLKEDLSEEEFLKLRTNFNIPSLGKLCCSYDRIKKVKKTNLYKNKFIEYDKD